MSSIRALSCRSDIAAGTTGHHWGQGSTTGTRVGQQGSTQQHKHHTQGTLSHSSRLSGHLSDLPSTSSQNGHGRSESSAEKSGWRKGSMQGNIGKIYKIRESPRGEIVTDNSLSLPHKLSALWLLLTFGGSNLTRLSRINFLMKLPYNTPTVAGAYQQASLCSMDMMSTPCQEH